TRPPRASGRSDALAPCAVCAGPNGERHVARTDATCRSCPGGRWRPPEATRSWLEDRARLDLFFVGQDRRDRLTGLFERTTVGGGFEDVFFGDTTREVFWFLFAFRRREFFGRRQLHRVRSDFVQDRALHRDFDPHAGEFGNVAGF